jgi:hypothetical protein
VVFGGGSRGGDGRAGRSLLTMEKSGFRRAGNPGFSMIIGDRWRHNAGDRR